MKRVFLAAVLTASLLGCGDKKPESHEFTLHTDKDLSPAQIETITNAAGALFKQCHALKEYLPDVVEHNAKIYDAKGFSESRDFGWRQFVEFDFTLSDKPKVVPREYYAAGHHCRFRVSGDEVATQKTPCAHLCMGAGAKVDGAYSLYIGKAVDGKPSSRPL
ncbi:hypothetical protein [Rhodocyclus tenuis]|uniref:Lipoprotein n=1 Tax=Rhodocyclus tenuis TaxID=1066 RepID=A0A840FWR8_RHOTE|nr:hypothetical protein [Rhodocyclus tenuis]MBB4246527.1 hypothetical protein [Rhodocyclus tenuis]